MPFFGKYSRCGRREELRATLDSIEPLVLFHFFADMRLKFLTLLMIFVVAITILLAINRFGFGILEDNFVASLNTTYKNSAQFMCFYGLLNFYLFTMAYVYSPSGKPVHGMFWHRENIHLHIKFVIIFFKISYNICHGFLKKNHIRIVTETSITKDNPAFSMVNDSDEDVIYGSDDESRRPLNSSSGKANDYDSD